MTSPLPSLRSAARLVPSVCGCGRHRGDGRTGRSRVSVRSGRRRSHIQRRAGGGVKRCRRPMAQHLVEHLEQARAPIRARGKLTQILGAWQGRQDHHPQSQARERSGELLGRVSPRLVAIQREQERRAQRLPPQVHQLSELTRAGVCAEQSHAQHGQVPALRDDVVQSALDHKDGWHERPFLGCSAGPVPARDRGADEAVSQQEEARRGQAQILGWPPAPTAGRVGISKAHCAYLRSRR